MDLPFGSFSAPAEASPRMAVKVLSGQVPLGESKPWCACRPATSIHHTESIHRAMKSDPQVLSQWGVIRLPCRAGGPHTSIL